MRTLTTKAGEFIQTSQTGTLPMRVVLNEFNPCGTYPLGLEARLGHSRAELRNRRLLMRKGCGIASCHFQRSDRGGDRNGKSQHLASATFIHHDMAISCKLTSIYVVFATHACHLFSHECDVALVHVLGLLNEIGSYLIIT